jgi:hypothetical protein
VAYFAVPKKASYEICAGHGKECSVDQAQQIKALRQWDVATLLRARAWWETTGAQLCGEKVAFNAIGAIQGALKGR